MKIFEMFKEIEDKYDLDWNPYTNYTSTISTEKPKPKIFIIKGSSASSRNKKDRIDAVVKKELGPGYKYETFSSFWPWVVWRVMRSIKKTKGPIVIIGKSLGGVRVWWMLTKYKEYFKTRNVRTGLIDAHGGQPGDDKACIYGRSKWNNLEGPYGVVDKGFCVFQRDEWPRGAKWFCHDVGIIWNGHKINSAPIENYRIMNTDHYKIINDPETLRLIREVVK